MAQTARKWWTGARARCEHGPAAIYSIDLGTEAGLALQKPFKVR